MVQLLLGLEPDEGDDDDLEEVFTGVPVNHDFAPYGNKTVRSSFICEIESHNHGTHLLLDVSPGCP